MKQFKIGLVYTSSPLTDISRWYSLLSSIGDVSLLLPHERSMRYDVIVIPDAGVNTNINTFKNKNYIAIGSTPICPLVEMFRIESLEYYIKNDVPVIGIGQSRCLISDIAGTKAALVGGIPVILPSEMIRVLSKDGGFIEDFESKNVYGLSNITSSSLFSILNDIKSKTLAGEMDSLHTIDVEKPISPTPLAAEEEEGW